MHFVRLVQELPLQAALLQRSLLRLDSLLLVPLGSRQLFLSFDDLCCICGVAITVFLLLVAQLLLQVVLHNDFPGSGAHSLTDGPFLVFLSFVPSNLDGEGFADSVLVVLPVGSVRLARMGDLHSEAGRGFCLGPPARLDLLLGQFGGRLGRRVEVRIERCRGGGRRFSQLLVAPGGRRRRLVPQIESGLGGGCQVPHPLPFQSLPAPLGQGDSPLVPVFFQNPLDLTHLPPRVLVFSLFRRIFLRRPPRRRQSLAAGGGLPSIGVEDEELLVFFGLRSMLLAPFGQGQFQLLVSLVSAFFGAEGSSSFRSLAHNFVACPSLFRLCC
mmetsp:Transcript_15053/g.32861  ORF Transcript_15053/g.32861 Transcript_15053/m.32861 type:complete len:327 (-) Transcript_15053:72-1052(-)